MNEINDVFRDLIKGLHDAIDEHEKEFLAAGILSPIDCKRDRRQVIDALSKDIHEFGYRLRVLQTQLN